MENLDGLDPDDLMSFWRDYSRPSKRTCRVLFGHSDYGALNAAKKVASYAGYKAIAMRCRAKGEIMRATYFENICDRIYAELPDYARW